MKRMIILSVLVMLVTGCASKPQVWVLKKSETALMDYAAIVPLKEPQNEVVAKIYGQYEDRRYEVPLEQSYLNAYIKNLLLGKNNQIFVQQGVLVIRNSAGGKIRIGADFFKSAPNGEVTMESEGGIFVGPTDKKRSGGLVTTMLDWIL